MNGRGLPLVLGRARHPQALTGRSPDRWPSCTISSPSSRPSHSIANGLERPTVDDTTYLDFRHRLEMYQYTHSAVMVAVAVLLSWFLFARFKGSRSESQFAEQHRSKPLMMAFLLWIPWYQHPAFDIPSHTLQFSPRRCSTRFPISGLTAPAGHPHRAVHQRGCWWCCGCTCCGRTANSEKRCEFRAGLDKPILKSEITEHQA